MKKYDNYKNSGVEWLGEIPEHWEVKKLKFIGNIYAGINGKKGDDFSKEYSDGIKSFIPFTNICNNIKIDDNQYQYVKIDEKENQNRVKKNDILFLMSSETLDDIAKNSIYLGDNTELYLNSFCKGFRITNQNINAEFINYLFLSKTYRNYFSLVGRGFTRINLKQEFINDAYTLLPKLEEQTAIAHFLDDKTTKIDQAIAIKQQQIDLLKERRQILIHKAVTRGLNDNVKLKDSGVEWIGEIPEGWEVKKIKHIFEQIKTGTTPSTSNPKFYDGEIDWYNPKDLNNENLKYSEKKISQLAINRKEISLFPSDSILIVGIGGTTGKTSYLINTGTFNQQITGFHSHKQYNKYYFYLFHSLSKVMLNTASYTTLPILNNEFFKSFRLIKPKIEEQKEIVEYIETATTKIATAISLKEQEIEKLKEYKMSLIDGVVSGKVKVC